jgi:mRNA interferase MazF
MTWSARTTEMSAQGPARGDVWVVDFDPTRGHEQAGRRPALVISADLLNQGHAGLVVVLPITSKQKNVRSHVRVEPPDGGLKVTSFVKCEDIRSVSTLRIKERWGRVSANTLATIEDALRILLSL